MSQRQAFTFSNYLFWIGLIVVFLVGCRPQNGTTPETAIAAALPTSTSAPSTVRLSTSEPLHTPVSPPASTPTLEGATCFINQIAGFTLQLPSGWYIEGPWDTEFQNLFYNYDPNLYGSEGNFPPAGQKIDLNVSPLETGISFEQWLAERRNNESSAGPVEIQLSEPVPYTLGKYTGVAYTATGYGDVFIIHLSGDQKLISIGLWPAGSSAQQEALAMLATLDVSGNGTCE